MQKSQNNITIEVKLNDYGRRNSHGQEVKVVVNLKEQHFQANIQIKQDASHINRSENFQKKQPEKVHIDRKNDLQDRVAEEKRKSILASKRQICLEKEQVCLEKVPQQRQRVSPEYSHKQRSPKSTNDRSNKSRQAKSIKQFKLFQIPQQESILKETQNSKIKELKQAYEIQEQRSQRSLSTNIRKQAQIKRRLIESQEVDDCYETKENGNVTYIKGRKLKQPRNRKSTAWNVERLVARPNRQNFCPCFARNRE